MSDKLACFKDTYFKDKKCFQALEVRVNALRKRGRRVILTGDLNISPDFIDSCEPGGTSCALSAFSVLQ